MDDEKAISKELAELLHSCRSENNLLKKNCEALNGQLAADKKLQKMKDFDVNSKLQLKIDELNELNGNLVKQIDDLRLAHKRLQELKTTQMSFSNSQSNNTCYNFFFTINSF